MTYRLTRRGRRLKAVLSWAVVVTCMVALLALFGLTMAAYWAPPPPVPCASPCPPNR